MRPLRFPLLALGILLIGGCSEKTTCPRIPPAAPRGLFSVTGDQQATLVWLANTERDLVGYRIYEAPCASGPECPYDRIDVLEATPGAEYEQYVVSGLDNGETRFFAVSAVNRAGQESDLSYNDVFDTPRPDGTGLVLNDFLTFPDHIGYDFSAFSRTNTTDPPTDIFYGYYEDEATGYIYQQIFVPDYGTDIQDAGYASSLDAVDFAPGPTEGWSPTGTVEVVVDHNYIVWTRDNHYAKFRVVSVSPEQVVLDWAYQVAPGNRELRAKRAAEEGNKRRPIVWLPR
jgi:hypothetical protein